MKTCTIIATSLLAMSPSHLVSGLTQNFNASFDDLTPIPEEGPLSPVGIYLNLSYTAFNFLQPDATADGLIPQSTPNYAYGAGSASNPAAISISYRRSTVQSFDLTSFYYGCLTIPPPGSAPLPIACTLTATAYSADPAEPVAAQQFVFEPAVGWKAPLAFGGFEDAFQVVERVTFEQLPATGRQFVVDNIVGSIAT